MSEVVHYIPVGFDFERLIQPISRSEIEADRIVILHSGSETEDSQAAEFAHKMAQRLHESFESILGIPTSREPINDLYRYADMYVFAYKQFLEEVRSDNEVYVNISSMPRTLAFAFATAADSLTGEYSESRGSIHVYYVSPEKYAVLDLIEELRSQRNFLQDRTENDDPELSERLESVTELLDRVSSLGVTEGTREIDGSMYLEIPSSPRADLRPIEEEILRYLLDNEGVPSISQLARKLAGQMNVESDDAFRNRVQYSVGSLEEEGYVEQTREGNRNRTSLTTVGELWARTHKSEANM